MRPTAASLPGSSCRSAKGTYGPGCAVSSGLVTILGGSGSPSRGSLLSRGKAPTMLVSRIDICSEVQEALQAGQALGLLTGQVQGAALVDLSQESTAQ